MRQRLANVLCEKRRVWLKSMHLEGAGFHPSLSMGVPRVINSEGGKVRVHCKEESCSRQLKCWKQRYKSSALAVQGPHVTALRDLITILGSYLTTNRTLFKYSPSHFVTGKFGRWQSRRFPACFPQHMWFYQMRNSLFFFEVHFLKIFLLPMCCASAKPLFCFLKVSTTNLSQWGRVGTFS